MPCMYMLCKVEKKHIFQLCSNTFFTFLLHKILPRFDMFEQYSYSLKELVNS